MAGRCKELHGHMALELLEELHMLQAQPIPARSERSERRVREILRRQKSVTETPVVMLCN